MINEIKANYAENTVRISSNEHNMSITLDLHEGTTACIPMAEAVSDTDKKLTHLINKLIDLIKNRAQNTQETIENEFRLFVQCRLVDVRKLIKTAILTYTNLSGEPIIVKQELGMTEINEKAKALTEAVLPEYSNVVHGDTYITIHQVFKEMNSIATVWEEAKLHQDIPINIIESIIKENDIPKPDNKLIAIGYMREGWEGLWIPNEDNQIDIITRDGHYLKSACPYLQFLSETKAVWKRVYFLK